MKTIKYAVAAIALSTLSFGAFAAQAISPAQAQSMNKVGVVSADGATTLDGLEAKLAEKAAAAGATGYSITSANGNNKMSGTAVIYKYECLAPSVTLRRALLQPSLTLLLLPFLARPVMRRAFFRLKRA